MEIGDDFDCEGDSPTPIAAPKDSRLSEDVGLPSGSTSLPSRGCLCCKNTSRPSSRWRRGYTERPQHVYRFFAVSGRHRLRRNKGVRPPSRFHQPGRGLIERWLVLAPPPFSNRTYFAQILLCLAALAQFFLLAHSATILGQKVGNTVLPTEYLDENCDGIIGVGEVGKGRLELTRKWPYNEDVECSLVLMAPPRQRLLMRWTKMDLFDKEETIDCDDRIFIYDGKQENAHLLTPPTGLCGHEPPEEVLRSSGRFVRVVFQSYNRLHIQGNTADGFSFVYSAFHTDECDADSFRCRNGHCIRKSLLCDGWDNCEDSSDEDASNGPCATFWSALFSKGYWAFGGIVAASVIAVTGIIACLVYCLCRNRKSSICGDAPTEAEKIPPVKGKGKITVDYTALYDKKHRGQGVRPGEQPKVKDSKDDPVKAAAKKSGWYDSVMWYTMKKNHRKPPIDVLYNEEMSQTSSSHQSSSTATSTSTSKTDEDEVGGKTLSGAPRTGTRASKAAPKTLQTLLVGKKSPGSEASFSTVESDVAPKRKKHVSRGPWGDVVEPKKHCDPKKLKGANKKVKKIEKY